MGAVADLVTTREAAGRVKRVHLGVRRLGDLEPLSSLVAAAPSEACRAVGLDRVTLWHVRDGMVCVASASNQHRPDETAGFIDAARRLRPRLRDCGPEHRAASGHEPVLVRGPRRPQGLVDLLGERSVTSAYIVAPIVVDGVTVGLLHGDRVAGAPEVDEFDAELLALFGAGLATRMRADDGQAAARADDGPLRAVTRREWQVLALLAEGASNARIADRLVISEGTVKTHVRHILRKLKASNRTEAVSRYHAFAATSGGLRDGDRA
jgi:DNA-binding CsgD family transcriptional regulator